MYTGFVGINAATSRACGQQDYSPRVGRFPVLVAKLEGATLARRHSPRAKGYGSDSSGVGQRVSGLNSIADADDFSAVYSAVTIYVLVHQPSTTPTASATGLVGAGTKHDIGIAFDCFTTSQPQPCVEIVDTGGDPVLGDDASE